MLNRVECDVPKEKAQRVTTDGRDDHFCQSLGGVRKASWKTRFSSFLAPSQDPPWCCECEKLRESGFLRPPWLLATWGWGLWPQFQFHIPFNGIMRNTSSTVYQHHWSSCSRNCCAVGKKRLLASFLHKRVWLNQRDIWLFNTLALINSDRTVEEVGLEFCGVDFGKNRPPLNTSWEAGRSWNTTTRWKSRISG